VFVRRKVRIVITYITRNHRTTASTLAALAAIVWQLDCHENRTKTGVSARAVRPGAPASVSRDCKLYLSCQIDCETEKSRRDFSTCVRAYRCLSRTYRAAADAAGTDYRLVNLFLFSFCYIILRVSRYAASTLLCNYS